MTETTPQTSSPFTVLTQVDQTVFGSPRVVYPAQTHVKPRSQMPPSRTATNAVRTIFRQWKFGKTMEKQGDSSEIIVRTNLL